MFEGMDAGTPLIIVIAVILVTFGVRLLDYLIVKLNKKRYNGDRDRRSSPVPSNPGNPGNNTSAVELGKISVRLEAVTDKLGVFHRDFFDRDNDQLTILREINTSIKDLDKSIEEGHGRLRKSVTELQGKIDRDILETQTMSGKISRFIKA